MTNMFKPRRKFGDQSNYSQFENDGTLVFKGNATVFDDCEPLGITVNTTGPNAPAFTAYSGGNLKAYEFVGVTTLKDFNCGFQMPHSYKVGSDVSPHLHLYIPDNVVGGVIKFSYEYTWTNISQTGAVSVSTGSGTLTRISNAGIAHNEILSLGILNGTGKTISSMLMMRLFRDPTDAADTFEASVWLKSIDLHFEKDTVGSRQILTK